MEKGAKGLAAGAAKEAKEVEAGVQNAAKKVPSSGKKSFPANLTLGLFKVEAGVEEGVKLLGMKGAASPIHEAAHAILFRLRLMLREAI